MAPETVRQRSGSEVVFGLLKTLMLGYRLWGNASAFELAQLSGFLRTSESRLGGALSFLDAEGLVSLDKAAGTVRLSDHGARNLLSSSLTRHGSDQRGLHRDCRLSRIAYREDDTP
jgi:hypothetical protein